jgi:hypothetical protein
MACDSECAKLAIDAVWKRPSATDPARVSDAEPIMSSAVQSKPGRWSFPIRLGLTTHYREGPASCLPATHGSHAGLRALKSPARMVLLTISRDRSIWSIVCPPPCLWLDCTHLPVSCVGPFSCALFPIRRGTTRADLPPDQFFPQTRSGPAHHGGSLAPLSYLVSHTLASVSGSLGG